MCSLPKITQHVWWSWDLNLGLQHRGPNSSPPRSLATTAALSVSLLCSYRLFIFLSVFLSLSSEGLYRHIYGSQYLCQIFSKRVWQCKMSLEKKQCAATFWKPIIFKCLLMWWVDLVLIYFLIYISFPIRASKDSLVCLFSKLHFFLCEKNCFFLTLANGNRTRARSQEEMMFSRRTHPGTSQHFHK